MKPSKALEKYLRLTRIVLQIHNEDTDDKWVDFIYDEMDMAWAKMTKEEREFYRNYPADHGCQCQGCGSLFKVDINVSDELWQLIRPNKPSIISPGGLLCGQCIMTRIETRGERDSFDMINWRDKEPINEAAHGEDA